ncbi:major facilitator superfamily domain-containing protein 6-like [Clytia hemisphaerica]|uniref:major facilitator superfamily domain-containing protein 6-like n=1 Tax=Clytia hemisphaerica TaxID=252671 RepID=UPI0034D3D534
MAGKRLKELFKVDMYMLPAKICFFLTVGIDGTFKPYMVPFLVGVGLNKAEAGLVMGLRLLGMTFAGPLWGFITDKRQNHVFIVILMTIMSLVLVGGQPLLSLVIGDKSTNTCPAPVAIETKANVTSNGISPTNQADSSINFRSTRFLVLLFINIFASAFDGCLISMMDAGVVKRILKSSKKKNFGRNRMFGAFGFSVGSILSGSLSDVFPYTDKVNCFAGAFVVLSLYLIGLAIASPFLFRESTVKNEAAKPSELKTFKESKSNTIEKRPEVDVDETPLKEIVFQTLKKFEMILFLLTVFVLGTLQGIYIGFTALRIKELDGSTTLVGITFGVVAFCTSLFMFLAAKLIKLLRGPWNALCLACLSYVVRFLAFAFISNPWFSIPIHILETLGFGLGLVTQVLYIKRNTDPRIHTTMLSIMNTTFFGVGFIAANIIGGQVFSRYGGQATFKYFGLLATAWSIVLLVVIFIKLCNQQKDKNTNLTTKKNNDETGMPTQA